MYKNKFLERALKGFPISETKKSNSKNTRNAMNLNYRNPEAAK